MLFLAFLQTPFSKLYNNSKPTITQKLSTNQYTYNVEKYSRKPCNCKQSNFQYPVNVEISHKKYSYSSIFSPQEIFERKGAL